ncbi:DNA-protecting protein DprA [Pseudohalioglobus sediminis]|uniref:DNA-protecting protein DprA n=1 Tax=Pseudohalioglobus sediminis TaxID=2606449 RepID=A0A5B0WWQ6_9GAMM|nr:DNA-processing protein DprA [Pseudohalioglobus sediminis]KAA1190571.1 DNA-protecting protein DprA [Pseudohalioglobus sediminis]
MSVADIQAALEAVGADVIPLADPRYPPLLKTINDPPQRLYVRGDPSLLQRPQLAMVGARRATAVGLKLAREIASALARAGLGVCSGLALGIDGAAHQGALAVGGPTIAVLGTGIDQLYPRRHRSLGEDVAARGCLVSEFPPGMPALPANFPQRNRIISGLSLGVLVVEAALPSGSLITANTGAQQGREVFALPWSVAHKGGAGCLQLIRDGAKMVLSVEDILEELQSLYDLQLSLSLESAGDEEPAADQPQILDYVGYEAVSVDQLVAASGVAAGELLAQLSALEMRGLVARCPGGYARTR